VDVPPHAVWWRSFRWPGLLAVVLVAAALVGLALPAPWWWLAGGMWITYEVLVASVLTATAWRAIRARTVASPESAAGPAITVVIAARNELAALPTTVTAVLTQCRAGDAVIVVDDGSTDGGAAAVAATMDLARTPDGWQGDRVRILVQPPAGKAAALNRAWAAAVTPVVVTVDADTRLHAGALEAFRRAFAADPGLVGACGVIIPAAGGGVVGTWLHLHQRLEYLRSFLWRLAWTRRNTLVLISGACAAYRRDAVVAVGGCDMRSRVEDYDLSFRLFRAGGTGVRTAVVPGACATTAAPATLPAFFRQRRRWFAGFIDTMWTHRDLIGDPRLGMLGRQHLPGKVIDAVMPVVGLLGWILLVAACLTGGPPLLVIVLALAKIAWDVALAITTAVLVRTWAPAIAWSVPQAATVALVEGLAFGPLRQVSALAGWCARRRAGAGWRPSRA
jgi:cellulose synthase/poly-beta-1,6-N-acetylglucosamine synthase-like glycosyltransferase